MYNFLIYDTSAIMRDVRTEIMHLDEMLRWEVNEELNRDREDLLEWRSWISAQLMAPVVKPPVIPEEEEYHGLW